MFQVEVSNDYEISSSSSWLNSSLSLSFKALLYEWIKNWLKSIEWDCTIWRGAQCERAGEILIMYYVNSRQSFFFATGLSHTGDQVRSEGNPSALANPFRHSHMTQINLMHAFFSLSQSSISTHTVEQSIKWKSPNFRHLFIFPLCLVMYLLAYICVLHNPRKSRARVVQ